MFAEGLLQTKGVGHPAGQHEGWQIGWGQLKLGQHWGGTGTQEIGVHVIGVVGGGWLQQGKAGRHIGRHGFGKGSYISITGPTGLVTQGWQRQQFRFGWQAIIGITLENFEYFSELVNFNSQNEIVWNERIHC